MAAEHASAYYAELYPCEGSLKPASPFDAEKDCDALRQAFKGAGTDEDAVIAVLAHRSVDQRMEIAKKFKTMFGKDLVQELHSELSGNFRKVCEGLCLAPAVYDATYLHDAMAGAGTNEAKLIELLCSRSNLQITKIKEAYKTLYKKDLEAGVKSETSGYFERVLVALLQASREENAPADAAKAVEDAKALFEAGEKRAGTDEARFVAVLVTRSRAHIHAVLAEYQKLRNGKTLESAIDSEFSGDVRTALLSVLRAQENKPAYFAALLHDTMKGAGTKDEQLLHIIITRCEVDMKQIKQEFLRLYKKPLVEWVIADVSGDYRKSLVALLGGPDAKE